MEPSYKPVEISFPVPRHPHLNLQASLTFLEGCSMVHLTTSTLGEGSTTHAPLGSFVYAMPDVWNPHLKFHLSSSSCPENFSHADTWNLIETQQPELHQHRAHHRRLKHRLRHAAVKDTGTTPQPASLRRMQYELRRLDGRGRDGGRCCCRQQHSGGRREEKVRIQCLSPTSSWASYASVLRLMLLLFGGPLPRIGIHCPSVCSYVGQM